MAPLWVLVATLLTFARGSAQQASPAGTGADPMNARFEEFLEAYDAASWELLRDFYAEAFAPGFVEGRFGDPASAALERIRLHREYGPVELYAVDTVGPTTVFWARGTVTGGWLGFEYAPSKDDPSRIGRSVLWRLLPGHHGSFRSLEGEALRDSLDVYLSAVEREGYFSGVVLILEGGETIFEGAYGYADRESGLANTLDTRFNIASSGKILTGAALLQLVEEGAVSLRDPLERWVPGYPDEIAERVRVEHLLTHTSGIELDEIDGYRKAIAEAKTLDEALAAQLRFADSLDPGEIDPGTEFDYTNEGVDLAGIVVARASGRPWKTTLETRILEPAGMGSTTFDAEPAGQGSAAGPVATGYALEPSADGRSLERVPVAHDDVHARPAGQQFSTARDLGRFVSALVDGEVLGEPWVERMTTPRVEIYAMPHFEAEAAYGYATQIERRGPVRWFGHAGGIPSGGSQVRHYPESGRTVVVLSNYGVMAPYIVAGHIEELVAQGSTASSREDR